VRVEMKKQNDRIEIAVRDNGPGVPAGDRERIFERFVRLEPARSGGAGLGLPIARWIAEAHGGSLMLAESSSAGSRFVVRLPVSGAQPAA
jgi:two-component system OmpR family sensor kinase